MQPHLEPSDSSLSRRACNVVWSRGVAPVHSHPRYFIPDGLITPHTRVPFLLSSPQIIRFITLDSCITPDSLMILDTSPPTLHPCTFSFPILHPPIDSPPIHSCMSAAKIPSIHSSPSDTSPAPSRSSPPSPSPSFSQSASSAFGVSHQAVCLLGDGFSIDMMSAETQACSRNVLDLQVFLYTYISFFNLYIFFICLIMCGPISDPRLGPGSCPGSGRVWPKGGAGSGAHIYMIASKVTAAAQIYVLLASLATCITFVGHYQFPCRGQEKEKKKKTQQKKVQQ